MKTILLVFSPTCGGAERMTILYGKIFEKKGYAVVALIMKLLSQQENQVASFIPAQWKTIVVNSRMRFFFYHIFTRIWKLRPDVVFTSSMGYNQIVSIGRKIGLIRSKVLVRLNNMPEKFTRNSRRISKLTLSGADIIIAQTEEMRIAAKECFNLPDDKVVTINNPIDKELIEQKIKQEIFQYDPNFINFVSTSRITKQKDYKTMLLAFDKVLHIMPDCRLYIVGDYKEDSTKHELDNIIENKNLKGKVLFMGFSDNPYKYLLKADVFCLSSEIEGLPNVMLEAMYLGVPVAVTRSIPFVQQTVEDGITGYTCDIHNPETFADCMIKASKLKNLPRFRDITNSIRIIEDLV